MVRPTKSGVMVDRRDQVLIGRLSEVARAELGKDISAQLRREREIAEMAMRNIVTNIERLVKRPETSIVHISELAQAVKDFRPEAIFACRPDSSFSCSGSRCNEASWVFSFPRS